MTTPGTIASSGTLARPGLCDVHRHQTKIVETSTLSVAKGSS
jgi:hypothetical protein